MKNIADVIEVRLKALEADNQNLAVALNYVLMLATKPPVRGSLLPCAPITVHDQELIVVAIRETLADHAEVPK